jgi:signal transduction histidine kinase
MRTSPSRPVDLVDPGLGTGARAQEPPAAADERPVPRRRWSLGLRARVTLGFALVGLLVSLALAAITYTLARNYLLEQRDQVARQQAYVNANLVRDVLRSPTDDGPLASVRTQSGGFALLNYQDRWFVQNARFQPDSLPAGLLSGVTSGETGFQRFDLDGEPYQGVGVYIAEADASYFESFPLTDLERTLGIIGTSLAIGATITTGVAALLGLWATRRLLRPVARVADAAEEIAGGGLDTRLDEESDPDLGRLVTSFNNMADAVQSRIEREARFASDVSHELRSPITALTAAVEVLDGRRTELPDRSRQALDVVVTQVRRFDQMVLDLLEISRLDAGALEVHTEDVLLGSLLHRIAARTGHADVPVEVEPSLRDEPVPVDKRRLERIVTNLLGNAEVHGGGPIRVAVQPGPARTYRIAVEDAGPGVPTAERERIFERFARGASALHRSGTGLGLALVAEHAALQGGRVWVEDRPGGGARFVVELPRDIG